MKKFKLKTGDTVKVIAGKDKGKTGKIMQVFVEKNRVVVEGVNIMKKHVRARGQGEQGQVIQLAAPLHVSNVMVLDPSKNVPTRIKIEVRDKKKIRIAKKSGTAI